MAITRVPPSSAPGGDPIYTLGGVYDRMPTATGAYTGSTAIPQTIAMTAAAGHTFDPSRSTALLTGRIAVPRDPDIRASLPPVTDAMRDATATRAAQQRADRFGLGDAAVPWLVSEFQHSGSFPDTSALTDEQRAAIQAAGGGGFSLAGLGIPGDPIAWAIGAGVILAIVVASRGGGARPRRWRR